MSSILLVCVANICRSPMAEVVFRARAPLLGLGRIESAGVRASPRGNPMDPRALAALAQRQYKAEKKWRSRRVAPVDFERFDQILAMDLEVLEALREQCPPPLLARLGLFLEDDAEVPDPYYGSAKGFEHVLNLIEARAEQLARSVLA